MNADDAPPAGGITAIAPWFGGKRGLASRIVSELGQHRSYLELFCGGLSVVMRKPQASYETVNDLHGDLTHLARCLQDEATAMWLYHQAARTLFAEEILSAASSLLAGAPPPEMDDPVDRHRGLAFLVQSWMMRNGVAGTNIGS
ncbi:MAG: DNA adenine methylase, partial [Planctomycetota bacterium]